MGQNYVPKIYKRPPAVSLNQEIEVIWIFSYDKKRINWRKYKLLQFFSSNMVIAKAIRQKKRYEYI